MPLVTVATRPNVKAASILGVRFSSHVQLVKQNSWNTEKKPLTALSRLPTKTLLRSLLLTSLMRRRWISRPSLAALDYITKSKSTLLNPDKNPALNKLLRWTIYNHFAAGTCHQEVVRSAAETKSIGYHGVIMGYAKEFVLENPSVSQSVETNNGYRQCHYRVVEDWKQGTLETLRMIQPGDFLAVKITGAGAIAVDAMMARKPMPKVISDAMNEICLETQRQGSKLWIDAEQQALQPVLDNWTIDLMRKHNKSGQALVYNTIQAYLKGSKANTHRHIQLAAEEGWTVGVKLVRGAYIEHEDRSLIHDTKEETDRSYDLLADIFIAQKMPDDSAHLQFPSSALFVATHNGASANKALTTYHQRIEDGLPTVGKLDCGQITGMADELSCQLLQTLEQRPRGAKDASSSPGVFKYLIWGSVSECLGYLHRRAIENRDAVERTQHMVAALKRELRRRVLG
ncbi:putative proline dehydrogenase [Colletotrichum siamense]|uniref:putative proline dehydrogenase n=1 Tax=Colletotrichum siamense TaxID=690259 RepID=UPI0018732900|nr:putative proline dehydrogenase [Colletotrichum siamense]KAF5516197.1 putative proline dehydrogenase [Colletotrichum siamense]